MVSGDIQVVRHFFENRNLVIGARYGAKSIVQLLDDFRSACRVNRKELLDLIYLRRGQAEPGNLVTGFVGVAGRQFEPNLCDADFFQFIDDAKYAGSAFRRDGSVGQQQVQNAPAGESNLVV